MSQVAGPYGLRIVKLVGDLPFSGGMHSLPLTVNQSSGFFFGDPVGLVGGQPVALTASPTTTAGPNSPLGIFMGCSYQDPVRGFVNSQFFPANGITAGAKNVYFKIADYPWLVMRVQANGPVNLNQVGLNAALVINMGSITTGDSAVALDASTIAAGSTLAVRIYDLVTDATPSPGAGSAPGDPFTDVLVVWNFGVHRYMQGTGQ
jgi:hypothetical protein